MSKTSREVAYEVLYEVIEEGAYANIALDKALFSCTLNALDKRFVTELVYGTIKYLRHLDYVLSFYVKRPLKITDKAAKLVLEMSAYQLLFMDKVPEHALVNEAVELIKSLGKEELANFINGTLRSLARNEVNIVWPDKKNKTKYLATYYSFPEWIIDIFMMRGKAKGAEAICKYFNAPSSLWIRTNTLKTSRDKLIEDLAEAGVKTIPSKKTAEGLLLCQGVNLRELKSVVEGEFIVQDESSMLVAHALNPQKEDVILDLCAAPGGKTTHIATLMENGGKIVACDLHQHRLGLIQQNAKRLGVTNITLEQMDASDLPDFWQESFDKVLVDAPCSGLGVLNRRADARMKKHRYQVKELKVLQAKILDEAAKVLKPKGVLLYSTCTMIKEENEKQVEAFLKRHPEFTLDINLPSFWQNTTGGENGMKQFLPHLDGVDGFFIARLVKA